MPSHQRYWGLHAPLPSLEVLISRKLDSHHRTQQPANGSSGPVSPAGLPPGSSRSSLFGLDSSSGGAETPPAMSPPGGGGKQQQQQQEQVETLSEMQQPAGQNGGLQPPAAGQQQLGEAQRTARLVPDERQRLQRRAWEALAHYRLWVRPLWGAGCGAPQRLAFAAVSLSSLGCSCAFALPDNILACSVELPSNAVHPSS